MKLIWTYSPKLNRTKNISEEDMLKLYYNSIECGKSYHKTCVYTDTPEKFIGKVDEIITLPESFEIYFLDDIKFFVLQNEPPNYTLIDGDYFIDKPIEEVKEDIGIENYIPHSLAYLHYGKTNNILEKNNVKDVISYWESSRGYFNLGLLQIQNFKSTEFIEEYSKLKTFYQVNIEGIHLDRLKVTVEISLCQYFFTLFCFSRDITHKIIYHPSHIHLHGPGTIDKENFLSSLKKKVLI
jgi:hypothetical protein